MSNGGKTSHTSGTKYSATSLEWSIWALYVHRQIDTCIFAAWRSLLTAWPQVDIVYLFIFLLIFSVNFELIL